MTTYMIPVDGPVSQPFGSSPGGFNPVGGHTGIDFAVPIGTPVRATADGIVQHSDWFHGLYSDNPWWIEPKFAGICVIIDHGIGKPASVYGHLIRTDMNDGDKVKKGDIIGYSGNTRDGVDTFPAHLHWEMLPDRWNFQNGTYGRVDPMLFVNAPDDEAPAPVAAPVAAGGTMRGVDISNYQKGIDLSAMGLDFVFIKASEGVNWSDPGFESNVAAARAAGLRTGFYHLSRFGANDGNTPEAEAASFIGFVTPHLQDGDVVILDIEKDDVSPAKAKAFVDIVSRELRRKCIIYTYLNNATAAGWEIVDQEYPLWIAQYPSSNAQGWGPSAACPATGWKTVLAWQYSEHGNVGGYAGEVDLNVLYGGDDAWNACTAGKFVPSTIAPASAEPAPVSSGNTRTVTNDVAWVRVAPNSGADLAPGYPEGIAKGASIVVTGYVNGEDPYGDGNNSWYITKSGYYVWTNAAEDNIAGLEFHNLTPAWCTVEGGDTLTSISIQFGVPLQQVINANPGININVITPGQRINLR